jgi:hypothetical protein
MNTEFNPSYWFKKRNNNQVLIRYVVLREHDSHFPVVLFDWVEIVRDGEKDYEPTDKTRTVHKTREDAENQVKLLFAYNLNDGWKLWSERYGLPPFQLVLEPRPKKIREKSRWG